MKKQKEQIKPIKPPKSMKFDELPLYSAESAANSLLVLKRQRSNKVIYSFVEIMEVIDQITLKLWDATLGQVYMINLDSEKNNLRMLK